MTSLAVRLQTAVKSAGDTQAPRTPSPGPVLLTDILSTRGGRPTLLALWAAWEQQKG
ncbi:MAG: hypothetical protein AAGF50_12630 [Pseudomonadota bacterium]